MLFLLNHVTKNAKPPTRQGVMKSQRKEIPDIIRKTPIEGCGAMRSAAAYPGTPVEMSARPRRCYRHGGIDSIENIAYCLFRGGRHIHVTQVDRSPESEQFVRVSSEREVRKIVLLDCI